MLPPETVNSDEASTFGALLTTLHVLSQQAELRGDEVSAVILRNVAGLLAELQVTQGLVAPVGGQAQRAAMLAAPCRTPS